MWEWRQKWPFPKGKKPYDPTAIKVVIHAECQRAGCKTKKNLQRHHKGNDFIFAVYWEHWYAERYIQFHPDDIAVLCKPCHQAVHKKYDVVMFKLKFDILRAGGADQLKKEILDTYRQACITICDQWMKRGKRVRKNAS